MGWSKWDIGCCCDNEECLTTDEIDTFDGPSIDAAWSITAVNVTTQILSGRLAATVESPGGVGSLPGALFIRGQLCPNQLPVGGWGDNELHIQVSLDWDDDADWATGDGYYHFIHGIGLYGCTFARYKFPPGIVENLYYVSVFAGSSEGDLATSITPVKGDTLKVIMTFDGTTLTMEYFVNATSIGTRNFTSWDVVDGGIGIVHQLHAEMDEAGSGSIASDWSLYFDDWSWEIVTPP